MPPLFFSFIRNSIKRKKNLKKKNQSGEERFQQSPRKSRFDPLSRKAITIIPIARINIESVVIGRAITGREMIVPILETFSADPRRRRRGFPWYGRFLEKIEQQAATERRRASRQAD